MSVVSERFVGPASVVPVDRGSGGSGSGSLGPDDPSDDHKRPAEGDDDAAPKKKFSRSRTACLQCRSRKAKCGALPPNPCPPCIEAALTCSWPTEDGRSSKARLMRSKSGHAPREAGSGAAPRAHALAHANANDSGNGHGAPSVKIEDGEGWIDRMLASGERTPSFAPHFTEPAFDMGSLPALAPFPFAPAAAPSQPLFNVAPANMFSPQTQGLLHTPAAYAPPLGAGAGATPGAVDPAHFIWAVASRLPTVEEGSPNDERGSSVSGPSPAVGESRATAKARDKKKEDGKIVKITWWRPHGQTAIAPGLKRITLKVRVHDPYTAIAASPQVGGPGMGPGDGPAELIAADGSPSTPIMRHLLDVFMTHFGCQFPFLDRRDIEAKIEARTGSVFLLNSIAAIAARFSTHPAIALPDLKPYDYGNVFYQRAKALLGSMLAVPNRETVAAFILLAHMGFANDSESEVWMMTGLAVRMSIDAGLHVNPPEESSISADDRRLNRLVFWSVLLMDYALSFGVGRQTTFRPEDITQLLPTDQDIAPPAACPVSIATGGTSACGGTSAGTGTPHQAFGAAAGDDAPRSPFPFAAAMMASYGPLINMLNTGQADAARAERDVQVARAAAIKQYNQLPADMQWNVANLQRHSRSAQGSIFLHLHLWMHTIIASGYLTASSHLRRHEPHFPNGAGGRSGAATPNSATASTLWRNSARTIGDILVLADIINPHAYFALPFVNQAWYVAGCCYVKEIEQHAGGQSAPPSPSASPRLRAALHMTPIGAVPSTDVGKVVDPARASSGAAGAGASSGAGAAASGAAVDLSRALLTSVATTNIATLQSGLSKLAVYWVGAEWIAGALGQRIQGVKDVDLASVNETLGSSVSLPDAGLVGRTAEPAGATPGPIPGIDLNDFDFLSLPFDLGALEGTSVIEQDVPFAQAFQPEWFLPPGHG
ncbi:hypothetical protein Q5752_001825 [Cryptotrichosporon argae]